MNLRRHPEDPRNLISNLPAAQRCNRSWPRQGRRGAIPHTQLTRTLQCQFCGFEPPDYAITRPALAQMFANPQLTVCRDTACLTAYVSQLFTEL